MSTSIEWTDEVWNFLGGCSPVSEGCRNCYAAQVAVIRQGNPQPIMKAKYSGTAEMRGTGKNRRAVFTGRVNLHEPTLSKPLSWKKPKRIFVNSMSDLFHESVSFEVIDRAFAVMALCPQHTFQILTKRPERMAEYMTTLTRQRLGAIAFQMGWLDVDHAEQLDRINQLFLNWGQGELWPLPNVWLGTSVENQASADERIPYLLQTPAAVRFLSCEPLLGPIDFTPPEWRGTNVNKNDWLQGLGWVIVGGESGRGARPMNLEWMRTIRDACLYRTDMGRPWGLPVFLKQLGARPYISLEGTNHLTVDLEDAKGGDWSEWPEDLRVREWPRVRVPA